MTIPDAVRAELQLHFRQRQMAKIVRAMNPNKLYRAIMRHPDLVALDNYFNRLYV